MALSASVDFSLTARQVVYDSLEDLGVVGAGETPSAADAEKGRRKLNTLLKSWQRYPNLWRMTEGSITLVADTYSYDLSTSIPHRVVSARYRDANSKDLPMEVLTREEYYNLPNKASSGIPTQYYVDYQRSYPVFYLWQALSSVTTETIKYTYLKKFDDIDSLDNDIEIRSEHLKMLIDNLSVALAPSFGRVSSARFAQIKEDAVTGLSMALDDDREDVIRFVPAYSSMGGGSESPY